MTLPISPSRMKLKAMTYEISNISPLRNPTSVHEITTNDETPVASRSRPVVAISSCGSWKDQGRTVGKFWQGFLSDPSKWCDHRLENVSPRYPDFKQKRTLPSLWLAHNSSFPWVEGVSTAMTPRTLQSKMITWNKRLARCVKAKEYVNTIELFKQMQREGMIPDKFTYVPVLRACSSLRALEHGRCIHRQIVLAGYELDVYVGSCLVDMYAKCESIEDAWKLFNKMPTRNVVSWTAMIQGYVKCGQGQKALELFRHMHGQDVEPDSFTFVSVLNACATVFALEEGRLVHERIIQGACKFDTFVGNSLVDMYAKCGSIEDAWKVFITMPIRDVVSWNAMILGFVKCGQGQKALQLFQQMLDEGMHPQPVTFVGVLNACANLVALEEGRVIHEQIIQRGYALDVYLGSCLVNMYSKCGSIEESWGVFNKLPKRNVVCWTAMIQGYVKSGQGQKALELFRQMHGEGVVPNPVTFVGALNACATLGALEEGRRVHNWIIQRGYESNVSVGNSLVDMYAKCGSIEDAWRVFNKMPTRNVVSWNSMLGGWAMHGHAKDALRYFEQMVQEGIQVNEVTFASLLSACSHAGLVDEGLHYFESIGVDYCTPATVDHYHYSGMVDLLGRSGRLHQAEDLIKTSLVSESNANMWISLLGACRVHGNVEMGERIAMRILNLDPENSTGYVLLSNIYAAAGKWDSSTAVKREALKRGLKKMPGLTWIEVNNEVHSFIVGDDEHPQIAEIHEELRKLSVQMKETGYLPDTRFVLHDVEDEEKVSHLCHHSEKLAVAYGLISTPPGTALRIFQNLRICGDCHTAIKSIAKIVGRAIIVRDGSHFHHFENGLCSCWDYGIGDTC